MIRLGALASVLAAVLTLGACAERPPAEAVGRRAPVALAPAPLPRFPATRTVGPRRSNAALARDFMELTFRMESGRALPVLTRFETPITLGITGIAPPGALDDLARVRARLAAEAGIVLHDARPGTTPGITLAFVPFAEMQALVPEAACFVEPRISGWDEFRAERRGRRLDWTTLRVRDRISVFIPADAPPQEVRDCLNEELAQAMGPLNDLWRLSDSVFNDDNVQSVLTGFDMLMLRVTYASELASGMGPATVAGRLPAVLARLNPRGERVRAGPPPDPTPRAWEDAVTTALGPRATDAARERAATEAIAIARAHGWTDSRAGFSWFTLGRIELGADPDVARAAFREAARIYHGARLPLAAADADMHLAGFALGAGDPGRALRLVDASLPAAAAGENAALLANLLRMRAIALGELGRAGPARTARDASLRWARYGYGIEPAADTATAGAGPTG